MVRHYLLECNFCSSATAIAGHALQKPGRAFLANYWFALVYFTAFLVKLFESLAKHYHFAKNNWDLSDIVHCLLRFLSAHTAYVYLVSFYYIFQINLAIRTLPVKLRHESAIRMFHFTRCFVFYSYERVENF